MKTTELRDSALIKVTNTVCLLVKSEDDAGMNALVKYNFVSGLETPVTEMPFRNGFAVASLRGETALALRMRNHSAPQRYSTCFRGVSPLNGSNPLYIDK